MGRGCDAASDICGSIPSIGKTFFNFAYYCNCSLVREDKTNGKKAETVRILVLNRANYFEP